MTSAPEVSVIMTVYNGGKHLRDAINSILQQSFQNFEFIIVDDGSTDATPQILSDMSQDTRVKIIATSRVGRARALNLAWQNAQGQFVANLDADDMSELDRLNKQLIFLKEHREVGLLGTSCTQIDSTSELIKVNHAMQGNEALQKVLVRTNPFVHSAVMMPYHVLKDLGGYNESFRKCIDYEMWVRIAQKYQVENLPDVLTIKRVHGDAYFRHHLPPQEQYKAHLRIRWKAWLSFSRSLTDLKYVFSEPIVWWYRYGFKH